MEGKKVKGWTCIGMWKSRGRGVRRDLGGAGFGEGVYSDEGGG